jgi:hypothetical protein
VGSSRRDAHCEGETDNDEINENIRTTTKTNATTEHSHIVDPFDTTSDLKAKPRMFTTKHNMPI